MNDRLKFRYWNTITNVMVNNPEMPYKQGWTIEQLFSDRGWIWEQCTGLKDKNGKLVFEGDIIKITRGKRQKFGFQPKIQITDVYFGNGAFRYRWEDGSGSVLDFNSVEIVKGYESVTQDVEVIGNIHQDSHLLGGK